MGHVSRSTATVCWILLIVVLLMSSCNGARSMQPFEGKPLKQSSGYFFGFLPRAMPIPPSGPSRQHNSIGFDQSHN
ncbi:Protein IDA-LIKE 2 [Rhynchospora pubera]|uniref:Protein IDA-LIKE 2 n=1 Tax=Rhynchospora pubera TaxID=906938 RepID=A0AAV8HBM4_9POAL|nr:Protein IDA-LIKE 2 [Rhynchospora pubera]